MSTGKVSIIITVLAFHASVLGIVYLTTRPEIEVMPPAESILNSPKKSSSAVPKVNANENKPVTDYIMHTVGANDYLGKIAAKYKGTTAAIIKLNNIKNANLISKGQNLRIPRQ